MCDYSLEHIASRAAAAGDRLVTTAFAGTSTRGFCAVGERHVAVCLRPGTELVFDAPVSFRGFFRFLLQMGQENSRTARFRQVNEGDPSHHHDALEFANGQVVLLTKLRTEQFATVIQLPVESHPPWQQPVRVSSTARAASQARNSTQTAAKSTAPD